MKKVFLGISLATVLFVGAGMAEAETMGMTARAQFKSSLMAGSNGAEVKALQQFLIERGFLKGTTATGFYGGMTRAAVAAMQRANGLEALGVIGPKTRAYLNANANTNMESPVYSDGASSVTPSISAISVLKPKVVVYGKKLTVVKIYAYSSGTEVASATLLGNAVLQSAAESNGTQVWTFTPRLGLYTEMYAEGYDANNALVGKVTLSHHGVSAIYDAFWGGATEPVAPAAPVSSSCTGVTGPMIRVQAPLENAWMYRGTSLNITWTSCNMSASDLVWFRINKNSAPGTEVLLTPGAGEPNDGSATYTLQTNLDAGTYTLHAGKLVTSSSGERTFQSWTAVPNLNVPSI